MRMHFPVMFATVVLAVAVACGGGQPAPPPAPVATGPNPDSLRLAEEARRREQARLDSIRLANERNELMRRRTADDAAAAAAATAEVRAMLGTRIHFDYDKADVRAGEDTRVLDQKVAILQANPALGIMVVGHADERGSDEYNLALGNRRALAARKYLTDRGIAADRIGTSSMGEEQPADPGSNEAAWAANRRGEFNISRGGETLSRPSGM